MHNTRERANDVDRQPERLRQLNHEMLKLSMAERRLRWKHYYAQVNSIFSDGIDADQKQRYRLFYEDARRKAAAGPLEIRDDLMLIAKLWSGLVEEYKARRCSDRDCGEPFS